MRLQAMRFDRIECRRHESEPVAIEFMVRKQSRNRRAINSSDTAKQRCPGSSKTLLLKSRNDNLAVESSVAVGWIVGVDARSALGCPGRASQCLSARPARVTALAARSGMHLRAAQRVEGGRARPPPVASASVSRGSAAQPDVSAGEADGRSCSARARRAALVGLWASFGPL